MSDRPALIGEPGDEGKRALPLRGISKERAASIARTVAAAYGFDAQAPLNDPDQPLNDPDHE